MLWLLCIFKQFGAKIQRYLGKDLHYDLQRWALIVKNEHDSSLVELLSLLEFHHNWPDYEKVAKKAEILFLKNKPSMQEIAEWFFTRKPFTMVGKALAYHSKNWLKSKNDRTLFIRNLWQENFGDLEEEELFLKYFHNFLQEEDHFYHLYNMLIMEDSNAFVVAKSLKINLEWILNYAYKLKKYVIFKRLKICEEIKKLARDQDYEKVVAYIYLLDKIKINKIPSKENIVMGHFLDRCARFFIGNKRVEIADFILTKFFYYDFDFLLYKGIYEIYVKKDPIGGLKTMKILNNFWHNKTFIEKKLYVKEHFKVTRISRIFLRRFETMADFWLAKALKVNKKFRAAKILFRQVAQNNDLLHGQIAVLELGYPLPTINNQSRVASCSLWEKNWLFTLKNFALSRSFFSFLLGLKHFIQLSPQIWTLEYIINYAVAQNGKSWACEISNLLKDNAPLIFPSCFPSLDLEGAPYLNYALIKQETLFVSVKGYNNDLGLAQINPEVAKVIIRKLNLNKTLEDVLKDDKFNLFLMSYIMNEAEKTIRKTLPEFIWLPSLIGAYNAGSPRFLRWLIMDDTIAYIDGLPIKSVANYIRCVMEDFINYSRVYKSYPNVVIRLDGQDYRLFRRVHVF